MKQNIRQKGARGMVKGVTRRVIVVKTPDRKLFEQAIFIVKEEAFSHKGVTAEQVLSEAQRVADGYVRRNSKWGKAVGRISAPWYAAAGALAASGIWALIVLL